jgi:Fe-Mn family superoxide dismutase
MSYQMKSLTCDPAKIKGMSERLIVSHYENNYGGAVKATSYVDTFMSVIRWQTVDRLLRKLADESGRKP